MNRTTHLPHIRHTRSSWQSITDFLRNWTLPVAMLTGGLSYWTYSHIPALASTRPFVIRAVAIVQPLLIFMMLFLTFCKVDLRELRLRKWHLWLLLFQGGTFAILSILLSLFPGFSAGIIVEGAILCLICPTATAAAVVTAKLNGDSAGLTAYTLLINLVVALLVPAFVPLIHPHAELSFLSSFFLIISKVFPLLICPLFAAVIVRKYCPKTHVSLIQRKNLAFYLWAVSLALAIAVTVRSIVHSHTPFLYLAGIAAASLTCCIIQFYVGHAIGRHYGCPIGAGQALGQKNTVFAIWMGYTFLTPVSSIAGGFYSIWHNVYNSWQLYLKRKEKCRNASGSRAVSS